MNDDGELKFIFLYLNFILFVVGVVIFAVLTNNKLVSIREELDILEAEAAALEAHMASLTDATTEEVTTEALIEPSEDQITISIRETTTEQATEATTELQEASTETLTEEPEEIVIEEADDVPESGYGTYLGWYELTAYEWTGNCCANGNYPTTGYTVACNSLALGTHIYIEGYGEYVVEDRGGMAGNVIDIYLGDPDACIQFGRQGANVYIID